MTVIPPSHHKSGVNYVWVDPSTALMLTQSSELPLGNKEMVQNIAHYYSKKYKLEEDSYSLVFGGDNKIDLYGFYPAVIEGGKLRCAHGSFNRIQKVAASLAHKDIALDEAAAELVSYDKNHHTGLCYFEDKSMGPDAKADPHSNAAFLIAKFRKGINADKIKRGEIIVSSALPSPKEVKKPKEKKDEIKLPPITGMMGLCVEYLNKAGKCENTEVNLGAAIIWLSSVTASRYAVITQAHITPCNLMVWGIMPSGVGKDAPQKLLQDLLHGHSMLGANAYKSAPSLLQAFTNKIRPATKSKPAELLKKGQREVLMIMDECSSLFRQATNGEGYQEDMPLVLNTLFSRSSGYFAGDSSIIRGDKYGQCWNPYVTTIGFTTVEHLKNVQGKNIVGNGFFERSLFFIKEKKGKYNDAPYKDKDIFNELKSFTDHCLSEPINLIDYGKQISPEQEILTEVAYRPFPINGEAEAVLQAFDKEIFHKDLEEFDRSFSNRFTELATKLSLLHALSEQASYISIDNVNWAIEMVLWSYSKAKIYLKEMKEDGEDVYKKAIEKIAHGIKKTGSDSISREELFKIRIEPKGRQRKSFIEELLSMKLIQETLVEGTRRREIRLSDV